MGPPKPLRAIQSDRIAGALAVLPVGTLFAASNEAVMIVDESTRHIVEANRAAARLLCVRQTELVGLNWLQAFSRASAGVLTRLLAFVRRAEPAGTVDIRSVALDDQLTATLSTFRVASETFLLVRLGQACGSAGVCKSGRSDVLAALDESAAGFVVTDHGLRVEFANRSFTQMVRLGSAADARGRSLALWLDFTADDVTQLCDQMKRREAAIVLLTTLSAGSPRARSVEVTAIAVPAVRQSRWGFSIRAMDLCPG